MGCASSSGANVVKALPGSQGSGKMSEADLKHHSLLYHEDPAPGKFAVLPIKPMNDARDLSLAYSPGVAFPCLEIQKNPDLAYRYTNKSNTVAVISNGTAVLGLGDIGPLGSKPVMEGKAVLFKKFADVDSFDVCIDCKNPDDLISVVSKLGPSFGGINLEDIKGPECFKVETELKKIMDIPVFHDDQHGTAIITLAAIINGLELTGRKKETSKLVVQGAGAAGIAIMKLLRNFGFQAENSMILDSKGVIYKGRKEGMNPYKEELASTTQDRTLRDALSGADIFVGCSGPKSVTKDEIALMNDQPMVFTMANPEPEIRPELVKEVKPTAICGTGRSDYPNQINNVMCFPFLFRGALDCRARQINEDMKLATAKALAALAKEPVPASVKEIYKGRNLTFGKEYIIPTPFDPRLLSILPIEVAKAAEKSGVARQPIADYARYKQELLVRKARTERY